MNCLPIIALACYSCGFPEPGGFRGLWVQGWWHAPWVILALVVAGASLFALLEFRLRRSRARTKALLRFIEERAEWIRTDAGPQRSHPIEDSTFASLRLTAKLSPPDLAFLIQLFSRVESHLDDSNFSIDWLADEMGLGRRQLERKVQNLTDHGPADLVRTMRIRRACQLLRSNGATVAEVARAVGFKSPSHFSRTFSRSMGEPPSVYAHGSDFTKS